MRWLVTLGLAAIVVLGLIWLFQRQLIYFPTQFVPGPPSDVEVVRFPTEDGLTLTGWLVPPDREDWRGTVIVFNGNGGNRSARLPLGRALARRGYGVLLADYRGYGGNPGSPSEDGLAADAMGALDYILTREDVDPDRIVYFGESLGAGVAVGLATEKSPAALILRSPATSLVDIAGVHYPLLPGSLLLRDRYPSRDRISDVSAPLMVVVGTGDRIVPPEMSRELYEIAPEPKRLLVIGGAGHNDLALLAGDEMIQGIVSFLNEALPADASGS